jgi:hypothetical protein
MKAALEAWGAGSNLFHQGFAAETENSELAAATMAKPGVVLKRPAGSNGAFTEHGGLPTDLTDTDERRRTKSRRQQPKGKSSAKVSDQPARKAAVDFEREQATRHAQHRKEEVAKAKARAKREKLVARAQAALDQAQREHEELAKSLIEERDAVEKRVEAEDARWNRTKERLTKALHRARSSRSI